MWCAYLVPEVLNGWECTDRIQGEARAGLNIVKRCSILPRLQISVVVIGDKREHTGRSRFFSKTRLSFVQTVYSLGAQSI